VYYYRVCGVNRGGIGEGAEVEVRIEGGGGGIAVYILAGLVSVAVLGTIIYLYYRKRGDEGHSTK